MGVNVVCAAWEKPQKGHLQRVQVDPTNVEPNVVYA